MKNTTRIGPWGTQHLSHLEGQWYELKPKCIHSVEFRRYRFESFISIMFTFTSHTHSEGHMSTPATSLEWYTFAAHLAWAIPKGLILDGGAESCLLGREDIDSRNKRIQYFVTSLFNITFSQDKSWANVKILQIMLRLCVCKCTFKQIYAIYRAFAVKRGEASQDIISSSFQSLQKKKKICSIFSCWFTSNLDKDTKSWE